ncbi:MAG: hypothetical protein C0485_07965 [Pirellula sp.]|nr:hypothetical protein [Pirellula sp.]
MPAAQVALDKTWEADDPTTFGVIQIRVVVLKKKVDKSGVTLEATTEVEDDDDEPVDFDENSPLSSYLETATRGRSCAVFTVNGQRHHAWDNTFLSRDLGLKYLKNRTMLIVDLDQLHPNVLAKLMQGSRQGLYEGKDFDAIRNRVLSTLKGDPELKRLQLDAEEEVASLETGGEAVMAALDQLIDHHHSAGSREVSGANQAGSDPTGANVSLGNNKPSKIVVAGNESEGEAADYPLLKEDKPSRVIRLTPDEERTFTFRCSPPQLWSDLSDLKIELTPKLPDLSVKLIRDKDSARLTLCYLEPDDAEPEEYPLITRLGVYAQFKGRPEPRMLEYQIVVRKSKPIQPPKPVVLLDEPTYLRVTSRQPVKIVAGGAASHVRLKWDGKDSLTAGDPQAWKLVASGENLPAPPVGFSKPCNGRFELLIDAPTATAVGSEYQYEVSAVGPSGQSLSVVFTGVIVAPAAPDLQSPRKVSHDAPEPSGQRRPPYEIKYVKKGDWENDTCWGSTEWTAYDAGAFTEPTETQPLTLIINVDSELLTDYLDHIIKVKKLDPNTVERRKTKYTAHLAFHLFQMFEHLARRRKNEDSDSDDNASRVPSDMDMRAETNRVAATLIRLMEVGT